MSILETYREWQLELEPSRSGSEARFRATALLMKASGLEVRTQKVAIDDPRDFTLHDDAVGRARSAARVWIDGDHARASAAALA